MITPKGESERLAEFGIRSQLPTGVLHRNMGSNPVTLTLSMTRRAKRLIMSLSHFILCQRKNIDSNTLD